MISQLFIVTLAILSSAKQPIPEDSATSEKREFSADVARLMKLIIHSLYSNKEIFLRELISNCADAMNKVKVEASTNPAIMGEGEMSKLDITIIPDEDAETLTIIDRGIGMTRDELIENLGTVAHSGTFKFFEAVANGTMDADFIGQFGVGFYSAFLVAEKVVVTSKTWNSTQHIWTSTGTQSYTIEEDTTGEDLLRGTKVMLYLKEKEAQYSNTTRVKDIIMKYSQFIDFPIYLRVEQEDTSYRAPKEDDDEPEPELEYVEPKYNFEHVNLEPAIWLRDPNEEISDGDYIAFFHTIAPEFNEDPRIWTHFHQTIDCHFKSILYIPGSIPKAGYSIGDSRYTNLRLYIKRVLITERLEHFLPRYFNFIRGVVDSDDLPLNVSREMLQETKDMRMIAKKIIRKIIQMMSEIAERAKDSEEDEDPYLTFYRDFGTQIKIGCIESGTDNRKKLVKLLRFNSTQHEEYPISLDEYVANMKPGQTEIYYIAGDPVQTTITHSPFLLPYKKKGYDVLFFPDSIDEAMAKELRQFEGKPFVSITQSDKNKAESEKEKQRLAQWKKEFSPLTHWFKRLLKNNITRVEISTRLAVDTKSPCVLSSAEGSVSPQLAEMIRAQEAQTQQRAYYEVKKVLEVNPRNDFIIRLNTALKEVEAQQKQQGSSRAGKEDMEKLEKLGRMMFETAMIDNGYPIEDPTVYADHVFEILTKMTGLPRAPVAPDDLIFDFDKAREEEEEEERLALEEERRQKAERRKLARESLSTGESGDDALEEEDERDKLFKVLDDSGPAHVNETYFREIPTEDPDDKREKDLKKRKEQRQRRKKAMEKDRLRKEAAKKRRGDDDDD